MMSLAKCKFLPAMVLAVCLAPVASAQESGVNLAPVIDRSGMVPGSAAEAMAATESLEARVGRLERVLENQALVDMLMRLDSIQADSQALRGELEEVVHALDALKQQQRDLYLDIDRRLRQAEVSANKALEIASKPVAATPATGGLVLVNPSASAVPTENRLAVAASIDVAPIDPVAERESYQAAFEELKQGRYEEAILAFQTFLNDFSGGAYAGNAQYWLGEANYVTRRYDVAEREFKTVLSQYPDSAKVADAMLKLGYTYYELAQWDNARSMLNNVVTKSPNTTVAKLAENRLQKMRMEGR